METVFK